MAKLRMLLLSFSHLESDARIIRQIELFKDKYDLTTCGYGPAPDGIASHVQIPDDAPHSNYSRPALLLHLYKYTYFHTPAVRFAREALRHRRFDMAWANDFNTLPLAFAVKPRLGVHCDLHEYFLTAENRTPRYQKFVQPFRLWTLRKYLPKCQSVTSVTPTIAQHYAEFSGRDVEVVTNAAVFEDLTATAVHEPIRLVHVGVAGPGRGLEEIIEATTAAKTDTMLDCILMPDKVGFIEKLREAAAKSGGKVRILPPVSHENLVMTMNLYDASLVFVQPTHFSYEYCLPNKIFQSVQARIAILTGPSPEIAAIVNKYGIGSVASGFTIPDIIQTIEAISPAEVTTWKQATAAAATDLCFEEESKVWVQALDSWAK